MKNEGIQMGNRQEKLLVCLFSDPNFLALSILESLLSQNCIVNIVTDNEKVWRVRTSQLADKSKYFITSLSDYKKISNFSYAIFCGGFLKKQNAMADFKEFISNKNFGSAKALAVFPLDIFSLKTSSKIAVSPNSGIVYVGDLLGPRIDLNSNLLVPSLIKEMIEKRTLTLGVGEQFFPVSSSDAAKVITKWLLSFGPYGKETFLIGPQTPSTDFWQANTRSFPDLRVLYDTDIETRFVPKGYEIRRLAGNLTTLLTVTYRWIIRDSMPKAKIENPPQKKEEEVKTPKKPKTKKALKKLPSLRFLRPVLIPLFLILFFPVFTTLISSGFLYLSYKNILNDRVQGAQSKALLAKTVYVIGRKESDVLAKVPLMGRFYREISFISYLGEITADITSNTAPLALTSKSLVNNILGNGVYDVNAPARQIETGLEYIYQQVSLAQLAVEEKNSENLLSARQLKNLIDFNKVKNLTQQSIVLANSLPNLLGEEENKDYLILFQNNMELRPTGGFIGSYGIASFGGGRLNGLTVNDIYSADGQLKGHVEPPAPIKEYLDEANWWFRDSNWNPDFTTSAKRAEWFLQKEMGQQVDGVIGVDLTPIKKILTYTGPIFLPDYNLTITAENLYEKTQQESQANFFPGSRKKASFLTALSRVLINEVTVMDSQKRIGLFKSIYDGLSERSIQAYFHQEDIQEAIAKLNWDGGVPTFTCGDGCYSDFVGDVEANLGVNKANYFIKREVQLDTFINGSKITRDLSLIIKNEANTYLGPSGQYQVYFRIMVPQDAKILSLKLIEGPSVDELSPDITQEDGRQEVGSFIEINPKETKTVKLIWESEIPEGKSINSYGLFVRKQAGTSDDLLNVKIKTPGKKVQALPAATLTKDGTSTYNTNLSRDFFTRLSW